MRCSKNSTCQLYFPIPHDGEEKDFIIFYYPDKGPHRRVAKCELFHDTNYMCFDDEEFKWEMLNSTHGLLTVSPRMAAHSGNFTCQIAGQDNTSLRCSWNPVGSCSGDNVTMNSETGDSTTPVRTEPKLDNSGIAGANALGIAVPVILAVVIALIVIVLILKFQVWQKLKNVFCKRAVPTDPEVYEMQETTQPMCTPSNE